MHSPSEVSMRSREGRWAVSKAGLGGGGLPQSPPGETDRQGRNGAVTGSLRLQGTAPHALGGGSGE